VLRVGSGPEQIGDFLARMWSLLHGEVSKQRQRLPRLEHGRLIPQAEVGRTEESETKAGHDQGLLANTASDNCTALLSFTPTFSACF
jgi:hypothetical protein